jgi:hypothetical protein
MAGAGQLTFDGHEVSALELDVPGISGKVKYRMPDGTDPVLHNRDRVRILVEYVVEDVHFPDKHNSEGVAIDKMKQVADLRIIVPEVIEVASVLRRAEIEAAWDAEHGATEGTG